MASRRTRRATLRHAALWVVLAALAVTGAPRLHGAENWAEERKAGPFFCRSEFPLKEHESLFQHLATLQRDLQQTLGVPGPREPIEIFLFRSKSSYQRYLKTAVPNAPDRRALYVKGNGPGRVYVYLHREMATDVRHEGTHALLHASLPMVPLWLDEGLAEYFEVPPNDRAFDNPHLSALKWNLRLGIAPRLDRLEAKRDLAQMSAGDYRNAWAWVHYMLHGPAEAREELIGFLHDIQEQVPPGSLGRRLERRLPQPQERLAEHLKTWKR